jgi:hypothetical protein
MHMPARCELQFRTLQFSVETGNVYLPSLSIRPAKWTPLHHSCVLVLRRTVSRARRIKSIRCLWT